MSRILNPNATIDPNTVVIVPECQSRVGMDAAIIEEYADAYADGAPMPPVDLYRDEDGQLYCGDGHYRIMGARQAGVDVRAIVYDGGMRAAQWRACAANAEHGVRRTAEDKRRAVAMAIALEPEMSDNELARHCRVSAHFVASVRVSDCANAQSDTQPEDTAKRVGGDGVKRPATADAAESQREKIKDYLAEHPTASCRETAAAVGCSPTTVGTVIAAPQEDAPGGHEAPAGPVDGLGQPIAGPLLEAWNERERSAAVIRQLCEARTDWRKLMDEDCRLLANAHPQRADADMTALIVNLRDREAWAMCQNCYGRLPDCAVCGTSGFVSKRYWEANKSVLPWATE